ncbi:MAG: hypothetical protein HY694_08075 [Deltaproteobacteria bacterium]|nr:hypothetical protein [Deltaproteobacteria bacterium]
MAKWHRGIHAIAQMGTKDIKRHCVVKEGAEGLLEMAINKLGLSARAYSRNGTGRQQNR